MHDKFNLHYGKKINLVQLEQARFFLPSGDPKTG